MGLIMDFKNSCDVGMHFGKLRDYYVKIGNDKKNFGCLPENVVFIPLAVLIMTTANISFPKFSEVFF